MDEVIGGINNEGVYRFMRRADEIPPELMKTITEKPESYYSKMPNRGSSPFDLAKSDKPPKKVEPVKKEEPKKEEPKKVNEKIEPTPEVKTKKNIPPATKQPVQKKVETPKKQKGQGGWQQGPKGGYRKMGPNGKWIYKGSMLMASLYDFFNKTAIGETNPQWEEAVDVAYEAIEAGLEYDAVMAEITAVVGAEFTDEFGDAIYDEAKEVFEKKADINEDVIVMLKRVDDNDKTINHEDVTTLVLGGLVEWSPGTESTFEVGKYMLTEKGKNVLDAISRTETASRKLANDPIKKIVDVNGVKIAIEWPVGSTRKWDGVDFERLMKVDYGYIKKTEGEDGEELDVYVGPNHSSKKVFEIDQLKAADEFDEDEVGEFDETKFMIGYDTIDEAKESYIYHISPEQFGGIKELTWEEFSKKVPKSQKTAGTITFDEIRRNIPKDAEEKPADEQKKIVEDVKRHLDGGGEVELVDDKPVTKKANEDPKYDLDDIILYNSDSGGQEYGKIIDVEFVDDTYIYKVYLGMLNEDVDPEEVDFRGLVNDVLHIDYAVEHNVIRVLSNGEMISIDGDTRKVVANVKVAEDVEYLDGMQFEEGDIVTITDFPGVPSFAVDRKGVVKGPGLVNGKVLVQLRDNETTVELEFPKAALESDKRR